jgi:hypothetical protein
MKAASTLGLSFAIAALSFSHAVGAALYPCCFENIKWPGNNNLSHFYYNTVSFPPGTPWETRLIESAQVWNDVPDSALYIGPEPSPGNITAINNLTSDIFFVSGNSSSVCPNSLNVCPTPNSIAWTFVVYNKSPSCCSSCACGNATGTAPFIREADIVLFGHSNGSLIHWTTGWPSGASWDPPANSLGYTAPLQPTGPFLLTTYVHEMGHALGLQHEGNGQSRMSYLDPNGGWFYTGYYRVRPLATDRGDVSVLYPNSFTPYSELYMSNVTSAYPGPPSLFGGDSSSSRPLSHNGSLTPPSAGDAFFPHNLNPIPGQSANWAHPGDTLSVQQCYGNLGNATSNTFTVNGYLSADRHQDAADVNVLSSSRPALNPRQSICLVRNIVIPPNTPYGWYYYISVLDGSNQGTAVVDQMIVVTP